MGKHGDPGARQRQLGQEARRANLAKQHVANLRNPLEGALGRARRMMAQTRGAAVSDAKRVVRVELSKLSLEALAAAAADSHTAATLTKSRVSAFAMYTRFCMDTGEAGAAVPITLDRARAYCTWAVAREGQALASRSLKQALSNLRVAATAMGHWGLDHNQGRALAAFGQQLCKVLPSQPPKRSPHSLLEPLRRAARSLTLEGDLEAHRDLALLTAMPGLWARGTEITGDPHGTSGVRFGDLTLDRRGLAFMASMCKTGKATLAVRTRVFPHLPEPYSTICPTRRIREYMDHLEHKGGDTGPDAPIFCRIGRGGAPTSIPLTGPEVKSIVSSRLISHGADPADINIHWGRSLASHLWEFHVLRDSSQKTRDLIDTMGDWAPTGKNVRRRHYSNPTLDEAWATVTSGLPTALGSACCKHSH